MDGKPQNRRVEFCEKIATMKQAKRRSKSHHLKRDYEKAIRKMQKELKAYDRYRNEAKQDA